MRPKQNVSSALTEITMHSIPQKNFNSENSEHTIKFSVVPEPMPIKISPRLKQEII